MSGGDGDSVDSVTCVRETVSVILKNRMSKCKPTMYAGLSKIDHALSISRLFAHCSPPKEGAYCDGLYLDGARWNRQEGCLEEPAPMELFYHMPIIHFKVGTGWPIKMHPSFPSSQSNRCSRFL